MTAPSPRPKRRWLWLTVALLLLMAAGLWWNADAGRELSRRARQVKIGQTFDEVAAIMGENKGRYYRTLSAKPRIECSGFVYLSTSQMAIDDWLYRYARWRPTLAWGHDYDRWPVHVRFDASNRVDRIKIGSDIVTQSSD